MRRIESGPARNGEVCALDIAELDRWLDERNLNGHWKGMGERAEFRPYLWRWSDIHEGLMIACDAVPMDATGRRTIQCRNPSLGDRMSNSIHMSVQCVLPGEVAKAHRHTAAATRFVIQGSPDAATVVQGEPFALETGDLITTPNWSWHDHYNHGSEPVIWLDVLDIRLISTGKMLGEPYSQDQQPIERPTGYTARTLGYVRPTSTTAEQQPPPFRYPWTETSAALTALKESEAEGDPFDGIQLTYTHPLTGGPTLPTFACELQLLAPGRRMQTHRHISTTIYQAFRGEGVTVVDGERLEWSQGDIFVVPPWAWHGHENRSSTDSVLFSVSDWPAMRAMGLHREEAE
jgi:1-hydroxy-2-naphthoate dioxygenase